MILWLELNHRPKMIRGDLVLNGESVADRQIGPCGKAIAGCPIVDGIRYAAEHRGHGFGAAEGLYDV